MKSFFIVIKMCQKVGDDLIKKYVRNLLCSSGTLYPNPIDYGTLPDTSQWISFKLINTQQVFFYCFVPIPTVCFTKMYESVRCKIYWFYFYYLLYV